VEIKEVSIKKAMNPTAINLGEYVINPYKGCSYACMYCYVRFNKVTMKEKRAWGDYVDVRVNAPELLEKELASKKPRSVLLGSTTECFGPYEKEFGVTRKILEILNKHGVYFSILTRSPIAAEYLDVLGKGFCKAIYFTVNDMDENLKNIFEPKSPQFLLRINAVNKMLDAGIPVIPYFSPILPGISKYDGIFGCFPKAGTIEFEALNFNLGNIKEMIAAVEGYLPEAGKLYRRMAEDKSLYTRTWDNIRTEIAEEAAKHKKSFHIYIHELHAYFNNKY